MKFTVNKAFAVFFAVMGLISAICFFKAFSIALSAPPSVTEEMVDNSMAVRRWEANEQHLWDCIKSQAGKNYRAADVFYVCSQQANQYYPRILKK